jgi:hypothetical protein
MSDKKFTWSDLKQLVNSMPESHLRNPVTIWQEDEEAGHVVTGAKVLEENYRYDGDEGCAPESVMKETYDDYEENKDVEYGIVHPAGMPILLIPVKVAG